MKIVIAKVVDSKLRKFAQILLYKLKQKNFFCHAAALKVKTRDANLLL
jgi:hypothetical protein